MTAPVKQTRLGALFSFEGRTRRLPFAIAAFAILVLWQLPWPVLEILITNGVSVYADAYSTVVALLACLALPLARIAARRLHDVGLSGWPGIVYLGHLVLVLLSTLSNVWRPLFATGWLHDVVSWGMVATTVVLTFLPGTKGENRFGADPRQSKQRAADSF